MLNSQGYESVDIQRLNQNVAVEQSDFVVQEYPIALVYNGISHTVMMATPADIDVFAKGFSLSEGILSSLKELYSLEIQETEFGIQVEMTISARAFMALKQHRRMMVGRTGCGLCGIESLQQLHFD
ncbi:MAG: formate dehydrogenase accessory sulfurtransferase FdhD, partial [Acinetobacter sp.]